MSSSLFTICVRSRCDFAGEGVADCGASPHLFGVLGGTPSQMQLVNAPYRLRDVANGLAGLSTVECASEGFRHWDRNVLRVDVSISVPGEVNVQVAPRHSVFVQLNRPSIAPDPTHPHEFTCLIWSRDSAERFPVRVLVLILARTVPWVSWRNITSRFHPSNVPEGRPFWKRVVCGSAGVLRQQLIEIRNKFVAHGGVVRCDGFEVSPSAVDLLFFADP